MDIDFLTAKGLYFRYFEQSPNYILENADFSFKKGKVTVMLGTSGCGKSTLAAVLCGLYPENGGVLSQGTITLYNGEALQDMDCQKRAGYLSMMFQNPDLQFCMDTLRKELQFCMENICVPKEEMDDRIQTFATKLHLEKMLDTPLHSLSGGEKQKAALCCLLLLNSQGFLFDEPFANLDDDSAKELVSLLKAHHQEYQTTILAIDHRLDHWLDIADEIVVLGPKGQILADGITKENLPSQQALFADQGLFYPREIPAFTPAPPKEALLVLEHLSICRGASKEYLLSDISAAIPKESFTALLGPSGTGKTTLFSAILGQKKYEGSIRLDGREIRNIKTRQLYREVGTVFQNPGNQFISTRILDEVLSSLKIWNQDLPEKTLIEKAQMLLNQYRLKPYQRYSPYMLSQGQQRRLAVLSILTGGQRLLLLDEPTYGQDQASTKAIMDQLTGLVRHQGLTVLFSTHDRRLAAEYADKIYEISEKELMEWKN
ncbi:MAG: ABC transporter ATP-binding protein [Blautia sp.]|jgi:energy-coupling factor transporter ATP-binding protein EcfA2